MSMAPEGTPHSQTSGDAVPPPMPGALALLTASALGGFLGSRLGAKPLALAAGATALAWMNSRKKAAVVPVLHPTTAEPHAQVPAQPLAVVLPPPPQVVATEPEVDPRIQEWLARQMIREEHAATLESIVSEPAEQAPDESKTYLGSLSQQVIEESPEAVPADEEDYRPEPLLPDVSTGTHLWQAEPFASLTDPAPAPPVEAGVESIEPIDLPPASEPAVKEALFPAAPPAVANEPFFRSTLFTPPTAGAFTAALVTPEPGPTGPSDTPRPVFATFKSVPAPLVPPLPDVSAIPGIEPLPSWSEAAHTPSSAADSANEVDLEALFSPAAFQGSTLPDEIHVPVSPQASAAPASQSFPLPEDPMAAFFKVPEPVRQPVEPPSEPDVPEISVHIAAAGEAWFDAPLADVPNPWLTPKVESEPPFPMPFAAFQPPTPVVDAEVVLRPRAPVQATVVPRNIPAPAKHTVIEQAPEDGNVDSSLPPAPVQSPREQRARPTWRSWWKGD